MRYSIPREYKTYEKTIYNDLSSYEDNNVNELDEIDFNSEFECGRLVYTLPNSNNHEETVFDLINHAVETQQPLFIASFIINYDKVVDKLIEASNDLQGRIFIITALERNIVRKRVTNETEEKHHFSSLERLSSAGIRIRNYQNGHWKLFLVGDEKALITSANLTKDAYRTNPEFGFLLNFKYHLSFIKKLFQTVWSNYTDQELFKDETPFKRDVEAKQNYTIENAFPIGGKLRIFSTLNDGSIKDSLIGYLRSAQESIDILNYVLEHEEIIDVLNNKASDVNVRIILPTLRSRYQRYIKKLNEVSNSIEIRFFLENHAKAIIIDKKHLILSTGNLDNYLTNPASLDLYLVIKNETIVTMFKKIYDKLFRISESTQRITTDVSLDEEIDIKLLIDSPARLSPKLGINLGRFLESIVSAELVFFNLVLKEKKYLIMETRKEIGINHLLQLEKMKNGYRITKINRIRKKIREIQPVAYKTINFKFYWLTTKKDSKKIKNEE